ncbi:SGNH/GDSL hydrolase family protein [Aquamicrobium soli]|jgi:lysophospholipase L1-like esterase|uniref:SGNH/GDSL hydrolase family protein n=1 Tax=Aquamicrobium soli TaxID=1811518 RepID=A0ABV7K486_9HYPH
MKTVLCYGDSLTWGYDAETGGGRHPLPDRWPSVLKAALGNVDVIAEGLNGRTTAFDDPLVSADRNGARILPTILSTHTPINLSILLLGTNDMKPAIHGNPQLAKRGMARLIEIIRSHDYPGGGHASDILLVAPPPIVATENAEFTELFAGGEASSQRLAGLYEEVADETGCGFFDAGKVAQATPRDGVHLDVANTRKIGEALAPVVRLMLQL